MYLLLRLWKQQAHCTFWYVARTGARRWDSRYSRAWVGTLEVGTHAYQLLRDAALLWCRVLLFFAHVWIARVVLFLWFQWTDTSRANCHWAIVVLSNIVGARRQDLVLCIDNLFSHERVCGRQVFGQLGHVQETSKWTMQDSFGEFGCHVSWQVVFHISLFASSARRATRSNDGVGSKE